MFLYQKIYTYHYIIFTTILQEHKQKRGTFAAAMEEFIDYIDPDKKATVFISQGFYARTALDAEKATLAKKRSFNLIKLTDIRSIDEVHGLYNHPNDMGMALIAERFWSAISPRIKVN